MGLQLRDMAPIQNLVYKYQKIDVFMTRMQYNVFKRQTTR